MDLQRAKELLSGLADGVDPLTGEVLPEDHVCNKAEIIRAFHCVLKSLPGKPPKPQPEKCGQTLERCRRCGPLPDVRCRRQQEGNVRLLQTLGGQLSRTSGAVGKNL